LHKTSLDYLISFFYRFFIAFLVLVSIGVITGRQLECKYSFGSWYLGPTFDHCYLSQVNLSKSFQSEVHSFTGSTAEKSKATVIWFERSSKIEFIPKEILKEFPTLNGFKFVHCNLPVLKNDFFSENFLVLEYIDFWQSQIASIEPFAFENLKNLKWLRLHGNNIQSLPFNLFQNNQKLFYLDFESNQINSISPNLFKTS
jgi:Leucine-rich repeat (LRR) protein